MDTEMRRRVSSADTAKCEDMISCMMFVYDNHYVDVAISMLIATS